MTRNMLLNNDKKKCAAFIGFLRIFLKILKTLSDKNTLWIFVVIVVVAIYTLFESGFQLDRVLRRSIFPPNPTGDDERNSLKWKFIIIYYYL